MARYALIAGAPRFVMCVFFNRCRVRPVRRTLGRDIQAHHIGWFDQQMPCFRCREHRGTGAFDSAGVHHALDEVVSLHAVLVGGAIGEMREGCLAQLVLFQFPEVLQLGADVESYRPVVVFSFDRVVQRLSLRMALDTRIVRLHVIETGRIDDVGPGGRAT